MGGTGGLGGWSQPTPTTRANLRDRLGSKARAARYELVMLTERAAASDILPPAPPMAWLGRLVWIKPEITLR